MAPDYLIRVIQGNWNLTAAESTITRNGWEERQPRRVFHVDTLRDIRHDRTECGYGDSKI